MTFNRAQLRIVSMCLTLAGGVGCASLHFDQGPQIETGGMTSLEAQQIVASERIELDATNAATQTSTRTTSTRHRVAPTKKHRIFYPKWSAGTCVNDGQSPYWGRLEYDDAEGCCSEHFAWKNDSCLQDAGVAPRSTATAATVPIPTVESDETDATEGCPTGWIAMERDCSSPAARAMYCENTLPAASTPLCDAGTSAADGLCLRHHSDFGAQWCRNPSPGKMLLSGQYGPLPGNG